MESKKPEVESITSPSSSTASAFATASRADRPGVAVGVGWKTAHIRSNTTHNCLGDSVATVAPRRPHALPFFVSTDERRGNTSRDIDSRACRGSLSGLSILDRLP